MMSEDHHHHHEGQRDTKEDAVVDANKQNEDNGVEANHGANYDSHHQKGSAGLKDEAPPSPSAAVNMTGSIRLSSPIISSLSKTESNSDESIIRGSCNNKLMNDEDRLLKQRFRYYSSSSEDDWASSSLSVINVDGTSSSRELTVQQILDQRAKLAATKPPGACSVSVPGAYSVNPCGRDSMCENEHYASSMRMRYSNDVPTTTASSSSMRMKNASAVVQLEAIPVDESFEHAKMKEMEEKMNREVQRRLSLERKIQDENREQRKTINETSNDCKICTKERTPIVTMGLLILLSGITVGLYFLLAPSKTTDAALQSKDTFFIYPPPSNDECEAVIQGASVPNQEKYSTMTLALKLDVSYMDTVDYSIDATLLELLENLAPTVVGCNDDDHNASQQNVGYTIATDRYLVANAQVMNVTRSTSADCTAAAEPLRCVRVTVNFVLWLKAETSVTETIAFVLANFGPMLLQSLSEGEIVHQTKLVSLGPYLQYPPPTAEECDAIMNGEEVPNQDQYSTVVIDTTYDISVSVSLDDDSMDAIMLEVRWVLESSMVPIMTGCNSIGQEIYNSNPTEIEYIFPNVRVLEVTRTSAPCHTGATQPCVQVKARLSIWLKRDLEAFDVILFMQNNFMESFMETISDSDIIQQFTMVSAGPAPV